jgi:glycosyltransferase involved in cell wall biosynthesis
MNYIIKSQLGIYIDITKFGENSGVPATVRNILFELSKENNLLLFTWDNEFGGLRNISYSESLEVLDHEIEIDTSSLWQKSHFNYEEFLSKVRDLKAMVILEPGVLIDEKNGFGTFRHILKLCKSVHLPTSTLLYDFIPLHGHDFNLETKQTYVKYLLDLSHASQVIAISKHVANEFVSIMKLMHPNMTNVIGTIPYVTLGTDIHLSTPRKNKMTEEKYILLFGTVEKRKNQILVMDIFKEILRENPSLCDWKLKIIGNLHRNMMSSFNELIYDCDQIEYEGAVPQEELVQAIDESSFTVFASVDEGFGLPIVESLARRKVCISANFGAMDEVSPFHDMKVDVRSRQKLKDKMFELMHSSDALGRLQEQLKSYIPRDWNQVVNELLKEINLARYDELPEQPYDGLQKTLMKNLGVSLDSRLTIVISTYNRRNQLMRNINEILRLMDKHKVELFILDNCSTDSTQECLSELRGVKWYSNIVNVGMLGNLREIPKYVSTSHVWVIGDDDFVTEQGLIRTLEYIRDEPEAALIVHNFNVIYPDADFNWIDGDIFSLPNVVVSTNHHSKKTEVLEIAGYHDNLFTAMYQFVWRQDLFRDAFTNYIVRQEFEDGWNSAPSAAYLCGKNAMLTGFWSSSVGIVSNGLNGWSKNRPRWHSVIMHDYIRSLTEQGFDKKLAAKWSLVQQNLFVESLDQADCNDPHITTQEFLVLRRFVVDEIKTFTPKFLELITKLSN